MQKMKLKIPFILLVSLVGAIGISLNLNTSYVEADSGSDQPLDCLQCHQQELDYHDVLGTGNEACWSCHDPVDMGKRHFANETSVPGSDSSQLCGQCHAEKYGAWDRGSHGFPDYQAACVFCHDPHKPQVYLGSIVKPPLGPAPDPPDLPTDLIMIIVITLVFLTGIAIIVARSEREQ